MNYTHQMEYDEKRKRSLEEKYRFVRNNSGWNTLSDIYEDVLKREIRSSDVSREDLINSMLHKMTSNAIVTKMYNSNETLLLRMRSDFMENKTLLHVHIKPFFFFVVKTLFMNKIINYKTLRNLYHGASEEIKHFIIREFLEPNKLRRGSSIRFMKTRGEMFNDTVKLLDLDLKWYAREIKALKIQYGSGSVESKIVMKLENPSYKIAYNSIRPADLSKHKRFFMNHDLIGYLSFQEEKRSSKHGNQANYMPHRIFKRNDFKQFDALRNSSIYQNICCVLNNISTENVAYADYKYIDFMYGYALKLCSMNMTGKNRCMYINSNEGELFKFRDGLYKYNGSEKVMNYIISKTKLLESPMNKTIDVSRIITKMLKEDVTKCDGILIISNNAQDVIFGPINEITKEFICIERYMAVSKKPFTVLHWIPISKNKDSNGFSIIHYKHDSVVTIQGYTDEIAKIIANGNIRNFKKDRLSDSIKKGEVLNKYTVRYERAELLKFIKGDIYEGFPF